MNIHPIDAENRYAGYLRLMHEEIRAGRGDARHAEELADRAEPSWYAMTPEGRQRMRDLSARLYAEAG